MLKKTQLSAILLFLLAGSLLYGQSEQSITFTLDQCMSNISGTNQDFSEFVSSSNNCGGISVVGNNLYRRNPEVNTHSCTPGIEGSPAMCVDSDMSCTFIPDSDKAVRFDIEVMNGGSLGALEFYQKSPLFFDWINGRSGVNNPPRNYAVRVLVNNEVVYSRTDLLATTNWNLVSFDFSSNAAFTVSQTTVFSFELTPYCVTNRGGDVSVWDLDEITITGNAGMNSNVSGGTLDGGPFTFCVGDGQADNITAGSITLSGNAGDNTQWIVTDAQGNILGLPAMPSVVDFDDQGAGVCLIWNISFNGEVAGLEVGGNIDDITGCSSISNQVIVNRVTSGAACDPDNGGGNGNGDCTANGGMLSGGPFTFDSVLDGTPDMISAGSISLTGNQGQNSQWVVTDDMGYILGLPPMPSAVNFDPPGPGLCLIWHLSFDGDITGAEVGLNANDIQGCFDLSNPIEVIRSVAGDCQANGGELFGGPFTFDMIGDGVPDTIAAGSITLTNSQGSNSQWVVTDDQGNILGLPPMPSVVDFDPQGEGVCLIWHLSFEGEITGAAVGMNADSIQGCFDLSNPITVNRINAPVACTANGGTLTGGPFTFDMIGDGVPDTLAADAITLSGNSGTNSQFIVTDSIGNILGFPNDPSAVDFDNQGEGICLIWHLSFEDTIVGAAVGLNANDLEGCFDLSNSVVINRINAPAPCPAAGGTLSGGPFNFDMIGDGTPDTIAVGSIMLTGNTGTNSQWVVTDDQGVILGLPPMPSAVDFDDQGEGVCLIWHLSFEDTIVGATVGLNANDIVGCSSLSNPITINRSSDGICTANGGTLAGGPFNFDMIGDGTPDMIMAGSITNMGTSGDSLVWLITNAAGEIIQIPDMPGSVDFDQLGEGTCQIWRLAFNGDVTGVAVGMNANGIAGCFDLSNALDVTRLTAQAECVVVGGTLSGGPFTFCVGDGTADVIPITEIMLDGSIGTNNQLVVTDADTVIIGTPSSIEDVDFDVLGQGACLIWNLSFEEGLMGAEIGMNANDLVGCFDLSNAITVNRETGGVACEEAGGSAGPAIIVINEIIADGNLIEFKNIGGEAFDISTYWICQFPTYELIGNLTLNCGNFLLGPNETVTVQTIRLDLDGADGEMGLYTTDQNNFGNSDFLVDYVEWGSTGHRRAVLAQEINIWTAGDFVPAFDDDNSLQYDGDGDTSADWVATTPDPCDVNGFRQAPTQHVSMALLGNPVQDIARVSLAAHTQFDELTLDIRDLTGTIVKSHNIKSPTANTEITIDLSSIPQGLYYVTVRELFGTASIKLVKN